MRRIILLFLVASSAHSSVSIFKTVMIYKQIITLNKIKNAPRLAINTDPNALPNGSYNKMKHMITINESLLREYDEDTVATTLGHELIHAKYKDIDTATMTSAESRKQEKRADIQGQILTEKAGWDSCKGFKWLKDLDIKDDPDHPDSVERNRYLGCH